MEVKDYLELEKKTFTIIKYFINFYLNKLNMSQKNALEYYKEGFGSSIINNFLLTDKFKFYSKSNNKNDKNNKNNKCNELEKKIKNVLINNYKLLFYIKDIDSIFRILPDYNKKITVYRGMYGCDKEMKDIIYILETYKIGSIFSIPSYISSSLDINRAVMYSPRQLFKSYIKKNITVLGKENIACNNIFNMFGDKFFFIMKINIPKNNKFIFLGKISKNIESDFKIANWEQEILLPRNSKIKLVKKYDKLFSHSIKLASYKIKNIIKDNIKYTPTRVYEFEYEGYDDKELTIPIIDKVELSTSLKNKKDMNLSKKIYDKVYDDRKKLQKKKLKEM